MLWVICFYVSVAIGLFGNHIMFYGDSLYNSGFSTLTGSLHTIQSSINTIGDSSALITEAFKEVEVLAAAAGTVTSLLTASPPLPSTEKD